MLQFLKAWVSQYSPPTLAERERAYLNASVSVADLERRQREIEQGLFRQTTFAF